MLTLLLASPGDTGQGQPPDTLHVHITRVTLWESPAPVAQTTGPGKTLHVCQYCRASVSYCLAGSTGRLKPGYAGKDLIGILHSFILIIIVTNTIITTTNGDHILRTRDGALHCLQVQLQKYLAGPEEFTKYIILQCYYWCSSRLIEILRKGKTMLCL